MKLEAIMAILAAELSTPRAVDLRLKRAKERSVCVSACVRMGACMYACI